MADPRKRPIHRVLQIANPAAGEEISISSNTGAFWLIHSLRFVLVTDATVATRAPRLILSQGDVEYFRAPARVTQAASLTQVYTAIKGIDGVGVVGITVNIGIPPEGIWLPQGHVLSTLTGSIAAGDQYSGVAGYISEFPTGAEFGMSPVAGYDNSRDE